MCAGGVVKCVNWGVGGDVRKCWGKCGGVGMCVGV